MAITVATSLFTLIFTWYQMSRLDGTAILVLGYIGLSMIIHIMRDPQCPGQMPSTMDDLMWETQFKKKKLLGMVHTINIQSGPPRLLSQFMTPITMVYGTYNIL